MSRDSDSKPVYRCMGTAYDPPEATTPARAKRIIRTAYCQHTGKTRLIVRAIYHAHDKATNTDTIRTSVIERIPPRSLSTGFHTTAEKRAEAAERDGHWRGLSFTEQLGSLDKRPGESKKQRARILAAAELAKNPKPVVKGVANKKQTAEEKGAKIMAHTQAVVAAHPTTRRRGPDDKK